jgi:hypothetical protein
MAKRTASSSRRKTGGGKTRVSDMGGPREEALWARGGPLEGRKRIPWAISRVDADGRTFRVKQFMRDDDRKEENMVLALIAALGWMAPAPQTLKVDVHYPELALFFECHESQHVDASHTFNTRSADAWTNQQATDRRKGAELVRQGFWGAIVAAFDGPFHGEATGRAVWNATPNIEVRRRALLAARTLVAERARAYAAGDFAGRVMFFSSAMVTDGGGNDDLRIGERFLSFDEINGAGRAALPHSVWRVEELRRAQTLSEARLSAVSTPSSPAAAAAAAASSSPSQTPDDDDDEDDGESSVDEIANELARCFSCGNPARIESRTGTADEWRAYCGIACTPAAVNAAAPVVTLVPVAGATNTWTIGTGPNAVTVATEQTTLPTAEK